MRTKTRKTKINMKNRMRTKNNTRGGSRKIKKNVKSGAGFFSKKPKFMSVLKKAQRSETSFINQYNKYANITDKYYKTLNKHIENLKALDFWLPETIGEDGAFLKLFREKILNIQERNKKLIINTENPLLVRRLAKETYNTIRDFARGFIKSQVRYLIWKKFFRQYHLIPSVDAIIPAKNSVDITLYPLYREPVTKRFTTQNVIIPTSEVTAWIKSVIVQFDKINYHSGHEGRDVVSAQEPGRIQAPWEQVPPAVKSNKNRYPSLPKKKPSAQQKGKIIPPWQQEENKAYQAEAPSLSKLDLDEIFGLKKTSLKKESKMKTKTKSRARTKSRAKSKIRSRTKKPTVDVGARDNSGENERCKNNQTLEECKKAGCWFVEDTNTCVPKKKRRPRKFNRSRRRQF